jgi:hypothetical protein
MRIYRNAHEHTGSAETLRPSPRNGFTAYIGLSSATGLCCHRRSREALASQELDTSVGVSGPHDFAVRNNIARPHARSARRYHRVHRIPRPTSVTIAIRPSCGRETGELVALICPTAKAKYFSRQGWTGFGDLPDEAGQVSSQLTGAGSGGLFSITERICVQKARGKSLRQFRMAAGAPMRVAASMIAAMWAVKRSKPRILRTRVKL